jgi:hypothetical protein
MSTKNVGNVKGRHHEIQRKEADDEKIKLEHEGVRVRVSVWVGVFHYKFEKKSYLGMSRPGQHV